MLTILPHGLRRGSNGAEGGKRGPYRDMGAKWADLRVRSSSWACLARNQPAPAGNVAYTHLIRLKKL